METYTTIYKTANGNLLYDSGNSNWGSVTQSDGERWDVGGKRKREETYAHLWLIHVDNLPIL